MSGNEFIYIQKSFLLILIKHEKFLCFFFYKTELEWLIAWHNETGWNVSTLTYCRQGRISPSSVPRTARKYPHSIQTPGNRQTLSPGSVKVQNYFLLFNCHILILRDICRIQMKFYNKLQNFAKAKWILKAFNCFLFCFGFFCTVSFNKSGNFQNVLKLTT